MTKSGSRLDAVERVLFPRALKLQIGCGAEPTLYPGLEDIVKRARKRGIPNITLVTNGQLLVNKIDLRRLVESGLNEVILSMHGTTKETYEYLMKGARFDNLLQLTEQLTKLKAEFPNFRIRINFTVNSMNQYDLTDDNFWSIWPGDVRPDVVQLRPVQDMGSCEWDDYNSEPLKSNYHRTIGNVAAYCMAHDVICIAPTVDQLEQVATDQDETTALIEDVTYYYVSPTAAYRDDFDIEAETFVQYHRRHHTARRLFKAIFRPNAGRSRNASKKLNYSIE